MPDGWLRILRRCWEAGATTVQIVRSKGLGFQVEGLVRVQVK